MTIKEVLACNENIDELELETYQICELPKINNFKCISIPLVSYDGQSLRYLVFDDVYIFDMHGVPEDDFEADDVLKFQAERLRGKYLEDFLIRKDWSFRTRDGSYDLPKVPIYTTIFSSFSLRVLSRSVSFCRLEKGTG